MERFPIDDSYIGFLRKDKSAISKNPKTIYRLRKILFGMGEKGIIAGASRPKSPSRQLGQMFRIWLSKIGYPSLPPDKFWTHRGIAILQGGDSALRKFAYERLKYKREKGIDLIIKVRNKFIIGEAKFISTGGGSQGGGFREAMNFIKQKKKIKNVVRIAVLDGVVWLISPKTLKGKKKPSLYESVLKLKNDELVFSSLFLKEFIRSN